MVGRKLHNSKFLRRVILFVFLSIAFCGYMSSDVAWATTIVELSDADQVAYSDFILHGTVTHLVSETTEKGLVVTRVTMQVHEWLKSPADWATPPETMDFYVRGGIQGEFVQAVSGEFKPELGDELVVMLEKIPRYEMRPMLVGLSYGAFIVDQTPITRWDGGRGLKRRIERQDLALYRRLPLSPEETQIQSASDLATLKKAILREVAREKSLKTVKKSIGWGE